MKSEHAKKKITCELCEYSATRKGHIGRHIQSLNEGKKFPCEL